MRTLASTLTTVDLRTVAPSEADRAEPLTWAPISPRHDSASLKEISVNLTFIAAYASKLDELGAHLMMTFKARLIMFPQESNGLLWVRDALTMTAW